MISKELLDEVRPLAERFAAAGHVVFLVGGIVRDQLLGRTIDPHIDIDLTTDAQPPVVKRLVAGLARAVWTQGERFGTIGCLIGDREYEITTHRGESYEPHSRKPSVVFSDAVEHDLARRDFTVNAMAASLPDGAIIDPFGGEADLAARRLRTPLAPEESFRDDPLRMLRAARFVAGYGLEPEPALVAAVHELAPRMAIVSAERRRDELDKLLSVDDPAPGLRFVVDHGLAPLVLPELAEATESARERVLTSLHALRRDPVLRLAAIVALHDEPDIGRLRHRLRAARYSNDAIDRVIRLVRGADVVWQHRGPWTAANVRRLAAITTAELDDALALASIRVDTIVVRRAVDEVRTREDLTALDPALDGDAVMSLLELSPGAAVGEALAYLRELRIEEGVLSAEDARARLEAWWREKN